MSGFYLEYQLNQYDIDGDGIFSGSEISPNQQEAMQKVISDTGRTFAPFTGFIFCGIITAIFFFSYKIINYIKKHL